MKTKTPYLDNTNYKLQVALYAVYPKMQADAVMLGDSITFGAQWNELLHRPMIANRGIAGDYCEGFLHRLEYVYNLHPDLCFIMGGINDLYEDIPPDVVFGNYVEIISALRSHQILPVVQSTLYVGTAWPRWREKNQEVLHLNGRLREYVEANDLTFIDLNRILSDGTTLRDDLTYDGLHLVARAYALWTKEVDRVLLQHNI